MKTAGARTGLFAVVFSLCIIWLQYNIYSRINKALAPIDSLVQRVIDELH